MLRHTSKRTFNAPIVTQRQAMHYTHRFKASLGSNGPVELVEVQLFSVDDRDMAKRGPKGRNAINDDIKISKRKCISWGNTQGTTKNSVAQRCQRKIEAFLHNQAKKMNFVQGSPWINKENLFSFQEGPKTPL